MPPLDLLKKEHEFPGNYPFKAVGEVEQHFESRVVEAVRTELALTTDPTYRTRLSASGIHCAVTIDLPVQRAEQVISVYQKVSNLPGLVLLL